MKPTMNYNEAAHGIELSFSGIPSAETREQMKSHGFRYHGRKKIWYAKLTEERDAFARSLCGVGDISQEREIPTSMKQEALYRYYTRRPADIGTFPTREVEPINIVNFDSRIPVEDGSFAAWGYVEYAEPLKQREIDNYELTPAVHKIELETAEKADLKKTENTFADNYERIGDAPILDSGDISLYKHREAYIRDLNIYYRRTYNSDSIHITDLTNAGKTGKSCDEYSVWISYGDDAIAALANGNDIRTITDLYAALCEGRDFESDIRAELRQQKGVDTFSPFVETKPLAHIPNRWNKRNFSIALLSGQIYGGHVDQRLTDDYAMDAARNFCEGIPIDIPKTARSAAQDWSSLTSVSGRDINEKDGTCHLDYYDGYSTSKTYYFDLHCDIKEGRRREEERQAGITRYNEMMRSACIKVSPDSIAPDKIYTLTTLDRSTNSGVYATSSEQLQGHVLQDRLDEDGPYIDILSVEEFPIQSDQLYSVADFYRHWEQEDEPDDRIIECGNWKQIVTGKALLELTAEGVCFPHIYKAENEYRNYESAYDTLSSLVSGQRRYLAGGKQPDYAHSLSCLEKEYARASIRSLKDMIQSAEIRRDVDTSSQKESISLER